MVKYIIKRVSPEEFRELKQTLPRIYEGTKKIIEENCSAEEMLGVQEGDGLNRLEIDGVRYSVKYNKKKRAVGIFTRKEGVEKLVRNDVLLSSDQQAVVRELFELLEYHLYLFIKFPNLLKIDTPPTEKYGNPWTRRN